MGEREDMVAPATSRCGAGPTIQTYNVPVLFPNMRREESLLQMSVALEYVERVAEDVFSRISHRVGESKEKLVDLNSRILLAQARVDKVKEFNKKATGVFSTSKYPAVGAVQTRSSFYKQPKEDVRAVSYPRTNFDKTRFQIGEGVVLEDMLAFYNIRSKVKKRVTQRAANEENRDEEGAGEGLGGLPSSIESVSSLLLFNTSENPYRKYVMIDPLVGVQSKTRSRVVEDEASLLSEAPTSITDGEQLDRMQKQSYFYTPGMAEVPEIDVPVSLPDLPGIADDVLYSADLPSIAPSLVMPDLPVIGTAADSGGASFASAAPPPPPPSDSAPPPPLPPADSALPSPAAPQVTAPSSPALTTTLPPVAAAAAAPPPPTAAPVPAPPPAPSAQPERASSGSSGRSSLLESIRQAGGSGKMKLKSTNDRKLKKKPPMEKENSSSGSGGIFIIAALQAKLRMRREGISGKKNKGSSGDGEDTEVPKALEGGGAMGKIAAMLPPPVPEQAEDAGSDWEA